MEFAKTTDGEFGVVPFTSKHWGQEFTCMAFRKEDEDLRGAFNDLIAEMKADGTSRRSRSSVRAVLRGPAAQRSPGVVGRVPDGAPRGAMTA